MVVPHKLSPGAKIEHGDLKEYNQPALMHPVSAKHV